MGAVTAAGDLDLDTVLQDLAELSVGAAILGLRQLNISRRELVERVPAVEPAVNAMLERIEELAGPSSNVVGSIVGAIGDATPGPLGDRMVRVGTAVAESGPLLLQLSGLTKRT